MKCTLLMIFLMLLAPCAPFAEEEQGIIYTVKEGDTLWDISRRFIKDPYYWPSLWSHNPEIGNPHLIYPGQKLRIIDGRIELIPTTPEEEPEAVAAELPPMEPLPEPVQLDMVSTLGGARGFIGTDELDAAGTLLDTVDNRIMISAGEKVFLEMQNLESLRPGDVFQMLEVDDKVYHPIDGRLVGYQVNDLGTAEVVGTTQSVAIAMITDAKKEILRGARVRPYVALPDEVPRIYSEQNLSGYIVTAAEGKLALGQYDVIHIDIGAKDGLEVGHQLEIFRERELTKAARKNAAEGIVLPDIELGRAIVLDVQEQTAAAVILEIGNQPLYRGDKVATVLP